MGEGQVHQGHRSRMRSKFLIHGSDVFDTYELLEMLLYYVFPNGDTNPVAKALLARFGGIDGVFSATEEELLAVPGIGKAAAEFLLAAGRVGLAGLLDREEEDNPFADFVSAGKYLCEYFAGETDRFFAAVFLDNGLHPLEIRVLSRGTDFDSAAMRPTPMIEAAIRAKAALIVLVHNHPHGVALPSEGDRVSQSVFRAAADLAGVPIAEHFVISGKRFCGVDSRPLAAFAEKAALENFFRTKTKGEEGVYE